MASFDDIWEQNYAAGQALNKYPLSDVVSFVFRHRPQRPNNTVSILEVGCGTAPNVAFMAREGFQVSGIDASKTAVRIASERLEKEGLKADLTIGDFCALPYKDESFDLVVDRAALTHADFPSMRRAIDEIRRVLKPRGRFLFIPFGDTHASFANSTLADNLTSIDVGGALAGHGQVTFVSRKEISVLFRDGWKLLQCRRNEHIDMLDAIEMVVSWTVIAEKT